MCIPFLSVRFRSNSSHLQDKLTQQKNKTPCFPKNLMSCWHPSPELVLFWRSGLLRSFSAPITLKPLIAHFSPSYSVYRKILRLSMVNPENTEILCEWPCLITLGALCPQGDGRSIAEVQSPFSLQPWMFMLFQKNSVTVWPSLSAPP